MFVIVTLWGALVLPVETLLKLRLLVLRLTRGNEFPIGLFMSDRI
jgi:hypothetical protein